MDIWYMTLNCAMDLSILVSIMIVVVLGYCLWKANEQTTQKIYRTIREKEPAICMDFRQMSLK